MNLVAEIDPITIKYKGKAETAGKLLFEDANGDDVELDVSWFGSAAPFFQGAPPTLTTLMLIPLRSDHSLEFSRALLRCDVRVGLLS